MALGLLISTAPRSQLQAMQIPFFYFMPSILLSGFAFPFRGMPNWSPTIGTILPLTHFLRVIRGSLLMGLGMGEGCARLAVLSLFVFVVTAVAMMRFRTTLD